MMRLAIAIALLSAFAGAGFVGAPASAHFCEDASGNDPDCQGDDCSDDGDVHYHDGRWHTCWAIPSPENDVVEVDQVSDATGVVI